MRGLPKISKRFVYLPDMDENEDPDAVYDFVIMIHPSYMKNKFATRIKLMEYFDELSDAIEKFQNEQSDIH
jgi:hypothetical protein